MSTREPEQQLFGGGLSRRELLRSVALGGGGLLGAYLIACSSGKKSPGGATVTGAPTAVGTPTLTENATLTSPTMTWTQLQPSGTLPDPRSDHSLVSDGQRLYLFGGRTQSARNDFWSYDIGANTWTEITAPGMQPRSGHNAVWDSTRNRMIVFGGDSNGRFLSDLWEFNPATSTWGEVPPVGGLSPAARSGAGAAFNPSGSLMVTHGLTGAGPLADSWQYIPAQRVWSDVTSTAAPPPRSLLRAVWDTHKERFLILGGKNETSKFLDDLWSYTLGSWQQLSRTPRPSGRSSCAMVFHNGGTQVILFGGNTQKGPANDLWSFHSNGENWTPIPAKGGPPAARYGHDAALTSQAPAIYVYGGTDGQQMFGDLWSLTLAS